MIDDLCAVVTVQENFDNLLVPSDHVSRKKSETYYVSEDRLLRAHTSAHQQALIQAGKDAFLVMGDVYRRDTIDSSHYPIFHQMELVRIFKPSDFPEEASTPEQRLRVVQQDLKETIENLVKHLFKDPGL